MKRFVVMEEFHLNQEDDELHQDDSGFEPIADFDIIEDAESFINNQKVSRGLHIWDNDSDLRVFPSLTSSQLDDYYEYYSRSDEDDREY